MPVSALGSAGSGQQVRDTRGRPLGSALATLPRKEKDGAGVGSRGGCEHPGVAVNTPRWCEHPGVAVASKELAKE